jgi:hypothetical protein
MIQIEYHRRLTLEIIRDLFKMFCDVYQVPCSPRDFSDINMQARSFVKTLSGDTNTIDYRLPSFGKFFIEGSSSQFYVWGYTKDTPQEEEAKRFEFLVKNYFQSRERKRMKQGHQEPRRQLELLLS